MVGTTFREINHVLIFKTPQFTMTVFRFRRIEYLRYFKSYKDHFCLMFMRKIFEKIRGGTQIRKWLGFQELVPHFKKFIFASLYKCRLPRQPSRHLNSFHLQEKEKSI